METTWSKPRLKQGLLELIAQDHVKTAFDYLQSGGVCLSGQPVPVLLGHHHTKNVSSDVQMEPPVFPFVPIASSPVSLALNVSLIPKAYYIQLTWQAFFFQILAFKPTNLISKHCTVFKTGQ